jgi:hypothetical protein
LKKGTNEVGSADETLCGRVANNWEVDSIKLDISI